MLITFFVGIHAVQGGQAPLDPVARMNYGGAFNLQSVYEKFPQLINTLGCAPNVLLNLQVDHSNPQGTYVRVSESENNLQELKAFHEACLKHLRKERRWAITEPMREAGLTLSLMGGASGSILMYLGTDSFGGSIGIFAAVFNSVWFIRDCVKSLLYLYKTLGHPVDELEREYVMNQCFIPNVIWSKILSKFMQARQNPFAQDGAIEFLQFTLGLRVFSPKPPLELTCEESRVTEHFKEKINTFFTQYQVPEDTEYPVHCPLVVNTQRFLMQLMGKNTSPRYLFMHGPGGIGKTYFTKQLKLWIEEICPGSVLFEEITINSPEDLEGSKLQPGLLLRMLRDQCLSGKLGSIVFLDEANWLNKNEYSGPKTCI